MAEVQVFNNYDTNQGNFKVFLDVLFSGSFCDKRMFTKVVTNK